MNTQLRTFLLAACLLTAMVGCVSEPPTPPQTQLQIRQYQTREYDLTDDKRVLKAALNVLQDEGFIVKTADAQLGLISASKETDISNSSNNMIFSVLGGGNDVRWPQTLVLDASVNVSTHGKTTRVRVNFLERTLDNHGAIMKTGSVKDISQYQEFFSRVEKGVFLEKEDL